ncbi:hypothetical protein CJ030_MR4G028402 [Morella rubra]|uniref:Uncharacterized protein n=1 Tax=Morella rubra TaxID=262757 RepID=A0A6A1VX62_9ROSI|nr:hypothetical protein CJ030_MR4G028402 [Morella rubra]
MDIGLPLLPESSIKDLPEDLEIKDLPSTFWVESKRLWHVVIVESVLAPWVESRPSTWVTLRSLSFPLPSMLLSASVLASCLAVHNGGDMLEAVNIARMITTPHDVSFHELSERQNLDSQALTDAVMNLAASVKGALRKMTDEHFVSQAMGVAGMVFIPLGLYLKVCRIFECVRVGPEKGFVPKEGSKIDYESLAQRELQEVRHVFARIVFDTVYPLKLDQEDNNV